MWRDVKVVGVGNVGRVFFARALVRGELAGDVIHKYIVCQLAARCNNDPRGNAFAEVAPANQTVLEGGPIWPELASIYDESRILPNEIP